MSYHTKNYSSNYLVSILGEKVKNHCLPFSFCSTFFFLFAIFQINIAYATFLNSSENQYTSDYVSKVGGTVINSDDYKTPGFYADDAYFAILDSNCNQVNISTPTTISSCNTDTICISITNLNGAKGVTYTGNVTMEIDIPGGGLIPYEVGSLTGATFVSYAADKLTVELSLGVIGETSEICFVVRPDCNVTSLSELLVISGLVAYATGYPVATETFASTPINVGKAFLTHTQESSNNPVYSFSQVLVNTFDVTNTGYGNTSELYYYTVNDNALNNVRLDARYDNTGSYSAVFTPVSEVPYSTNQTLRTYRITGALLGPDGILSEGERVGFRERVTPPDNCAEYSNIHWVDYSCGVGNPSCVEPVEITTVIRIRAGIPLLSATLINAEQPDGCPDKAVSYTVTNTGTGNAAPVGNAYDVDLTINMGSSLITMDNLQLNGMTVPLANISPVPSQPARKYTINLKDLMTTDPDGVGGIDDLDGDGFYDDMLAGATTTVSFTYSIPCEFACSANLYYQLSSSATYTDFCRVLDGSERTSLLNFGFEQVQPIVQTTPTPDYGDTPPTGTSLDAVFDFQYEAVNMDLSNATAQLQIYYSDNMEVDASSIRINGVAPTNTPILAGTGATFGGTPGVMDSDSAWIVDLTPAELAELTDDTPDNLLYTQTRYSCATDRQVTEASDSWQLVYALQSGLCTDGSTPCNFDLACNKPYAYSYLEVCGSVAPSACYLNSLTISREDPAGYTDVTENTLNPTIDEAASYVGDTVRIQIDGYINGDDPQEPNGFYSAQGLYKQDMEVAFQINYTKPADWNENSSIGKFLSGYSTIVVRERTPDSNDRNALGTIGAVLIEAPILLEDFSAVGGNRNQPASNQTDYASGTSPFDLNDYCATNGIAGIGLCPYDLGQRYLAGFSNISRTRRVSDDSTKVTDFYTLWIGKALARAGWYEDGGDDNFYYEINTRWVMDETFPWDNSNDWLVVTNGISHEGDNRLDFEEGTLNVNCNSLSQATHVTVSRDITVNRPKRVYNTDCGLRAVNVLFFDSFQGDYFDNGTGEVRVPYKLDSVVVDVPSEYAVSNFQFDYYQGCALQTTAMVAASATTGHIQFTNSAGGDFPRMDDCAGNQLAYNLSYDLTKTGTAAPMNYKLPVTYYLKDEFDNVVLRHDTMSISEQDPDLTLTSLTPVLPVIDGGDCSTAYFDFLIQNNTFYDAPNVYFAAEGTANTTMVDITDGDSIYFDPIIAADLTSYGSGSLFVKLGTLEAGDTRLVRVFANTAVCTDDFDVYTDFGCAYPSPIAPNLASGTIKTAAASYVADAPQILSDMVTQQLNITDLCGTQEIELEIRNANLSNIYELLVGVKLPPSMNYVAGTAQILHPEDGSYANIVTVATPNGVLGDSIVLDLKNNSPFTTICGLTGSDTTTLNDISIKFEIEFQACPANGSDFVAFNISGENYCGTTSDAFVIMPVYYIGSAGTQNNYSLSTNTTSLEVCALNGATENINDTLSITNIGGFDTASGVSSGLDSVSFTLFADTSKLNLANITLGAPFSGATLGTDISGNTTLKVAVPAGIAIDDSIDVPISYDLTPTVDSLCLKDDPDLLCYYALFTSPAVLECAAKSLSCGSVSKNIRGTGLVTKGIDCCFGSIGDYVFYDVDNSNTQTLGDTALQDIKVYLVSSGMIIDSTLTDVDGLYLFDSLFAGVYSVQFVAPNGFSFITVDTGDDISDSDASSDGTTGDYTIDTSRPEGDSNRDITTVDAGVFCDIIAPVIAGNQAICEGSDPTAFTVTTAISSSNSTITYQWQRSTTDPLSGYANISSANSSTYDAPTGTTDTTYYRVIACAGGDCNSGSCADTSNYVFVFFSLCDWGDLPDISTGTGTNDYQTINANNGPAHLIIPDLSLGSMVDGETDGQPSSNALGDGVDEDGLTMFATLDLSPGMAFRLPFTYVNTTGNTAYVVAWIDWNGDGAFDGADEMVINWDDSVGSLPDRMEITIPQNAITGSQLGWRIRISNQDNMTPYGLQPNGEVEDYLIGIDCPQVCLPIQVTVIKN